MRPIFEGDELTAEAKEISRTKTLGNYDVVVRNQKEVIVALFKGLVFVKMLNGNKKPLKRTPTVYNK